MLNIIFFTILFIISYQDFKKKKINNFFIVLILLLGVLSAVFQEVCEVPGRIAGFFCISIPMFFISYIKSGVLGGGDIKLMAVCGFYLGAERIAMAAALSVFLAAAFCIVFIIMKKVDKKTAIPLAPFLSMGMFVVTFWEPASLLF